MRIDKDPHICSVFQLHYLGEPIPESNAYHPPYSSDGPVAKTLDEFKAECRKAVKKYEECLTKYEQYASPRCGSFVFATTIEHQPVVTQHLIDLGFTGTGFIPFGKYIHKAQFLVMPLPLFIPAIGLEYFLRREINKYY